MNISRLNGIVFVPQLEVEVLQAVGITVQSVLDWNDPFLQSRMLQACVSFASALLDAPGVTADCRLKVTSCLLLCCASLSNCAIKGSSKCHQSLLLIVPVLPAVQSRAYCHVTKAPCSVESLHKFA